MTPVRRGRMWPLLFVLAALGAGVTVWLSAGAEVASIGPTGATPAGPPSAELVELSLASAVLVEAVGCGAESFGVGVAVDGGVITNAHVVAGSSEVLLTTSGGAVHQAIVVAFDPLLDLALLESAELEAPRLELATPSGGTEGVVLARRSQTNGEAELIPVTASVERTINIFIADIYGEGRHERRGLELAAELGPGDSGSAVIDGEGNVLGIVFSTSRRADGVAYAVSATEVGQFVAGRSVGSIGSGDCR